MTKKFYITAAIPYVNAKPHIGHALEFTQTNTIARYHKLLGEEVLSLSGGDENALKNVQAAENANESISDFVDKNTKYFFDLTKKLNSEFDVWQKGSDQEKHFPSSQKLWELCEKSGDIYKKSYTGLYCVGCETFYSPDELNENKECFEHPGKKLEEISEENYFFKLSKYQDQLIYLIESNEIKIVPENYKTEILSFLKSGLQDISISRSNERAKNWGVPVPGDPDQRIYVWFDALNIYQSGIGFGWDEEKYSKWWPADAHIIGKGIIRFHAVYWPAFLLSAQLPLPKEIFVHGYITVNGQKMSKTLGNVIDPVELLEKYGTDPVRYYFLAKISPFSDGDFSYEKFEESYNADLANGLGNTISRVAKMAEKSGFEFPNSETSTIYSEVSTHLDNYRFDKALEKIWSELSLIDQAINLEEPWKLEGEVLKEKLSRYIGAIKHIAHNLKPFLPETAEKIASQFTRPKIQTASPLFPRLG